MDDWEYRDRSHFPTFAWAQKWDVRWGSVARNPSSLNWENGTCPYIPTSRCWSPTLAQALMRFTVVILVRHALIRTLVLVTISPRKTLRVLRNGHVKREKLIW